MALSFLELVMEFKVEASSFLCLFLIPVFLRCLSRRRVEGKLPPNPPRLPFIGNLHQLGIAPHRSLLQLSRKHGPLMYLKLGQIPHVVVSSAENACAYLKTHDLVFCSRPGLAVARKLSYGFRDIAFSPYSDHWRQVRKIGTFEIFATKIVEMQRPVREEEVGILVQTIQGLSSSGPVNLSEMIFSYFTNIACMNVFGKRSSKEGQWGENKFLGLIEESKALLGAFWVGDFFPSLHWIDTFTGLQKRLDETFYGLDQFLEKEIESQLRSPTADNSRIIHSMLQLLKDSTLGIPFSKEHIKALIMDIFIAGIDTGAITADWAMAELVRNPRVMRKAQDELSRVMKGRVVVDESDLSNLKYLKQVVKETMRLHPPGAFMFRESREECSVDGFVFPAKIRVIINAWAIGRDPDCWKDPEEFWPERFEDSPIDYKGQHFELIPFGSGRRMCPGMALGATMVELALANLLHCFNWELPEGATKNDLDMSDKFGFVTRRTSQFILRATPLKH